MRKLVGNGYNDWNPKVEVFIQSSRAQFFVRIYQTDILLERQMCSRF